MTFLNAKESKEIAALINKEWDADFSFTDFVIKTTKDRIYIVSRDIENIDFEQYNIESMGLYFGTLSERYDEIRLSIEGSQIVGPMAKKNVIELGNLAKVWMAGNDVSFKTDYTGMVILKHDGDYLGSGKIKQKEVTVLDEEGKEKKEMQTVILNFVPKTRRHVKD